jgi:hypothetical protein
MNDDELIYESLNNGKKNKTDLVCQIINYISLIPTIVYNSIWYIVMSNILKETNESETNQCYDLNRWVNYCFTWMIVSVMKALFFLCFVRICFGSENDCNIFCLILKALSGIIGSIVFVLNIPDYLTNTHNTNTTCYKLEKSLSLFHKCEYTYILFVLSLFCLIPLGASLMGMKEYLKSRRYKEIS